MKRNRARENQVAAIIQSATFGWQIPMMSIGAVCLAGERAAGTTGPVDEAAVRSAVLLTLEALAVRSGVDQ